ncbi:MAG: cobyrinic acid a,c-diamide synthase, partial [Gemmatimonadaceae bacterium]
VATIEPYYRSMETARRVAALAAEMGITDVTLIANKVRDDSDRRAIGEFCDAHSLELIGEIPFDLTLIDAERAGKTPIDYDPNGPAVKAIERLAATLDARK